MNKGMLIGAIAGLGVAIAGGVAGFSRLNQPAADDEQISAELDSASVDDVEAAPQAQNLTPAQRCWDEEVEVQAEPKDDKAIAGTAAGAVIGGALADRLGDDDLVTAAGAAAGAFIGRKAQREYQERRTTTTTVTRCEPQ